MHSARPTGVSTGPVPGPSALLTPIDAALARLGALSDREREVFSLLAHAPSYEAVADRLGISRRTVRFHIERIRQKLGDLSYHHLCAASYLEAVRPPRSSSVAVP